MDENWERIKEKILGLKGLASIGFADIVGSGITSLFWFYIATVLSPAEYGEIHYHVGFAGIASYVSMFGTLNSIQVYTAKNVKVQSTLYFISLSIGAVSSIVLISFLGRIDTSLLLIGYIINNSAIGYILGKGDYSGYAKHVIAQKILTLVLGLLFYYVFGANGIIYALSLSYVSFGIIIYRVFKEIRINFGTLKARMGFIVNNYLLFLLGGFSGGIDKLVIGSLLGFSLLGNYSLAMQLFGVLLMFSSIIFKFVLTEDSSGNPNKKLKKFTMIGAIIVTILGIIISPSIISLFFPKYREIITTIQIMSLAVIPTTLTMINSSNLLALEKSRFVLVGNATALFIIIMGLITLGPLFGTVGAGITFVLSTTAEAILLALFNYRIRDSDFLVGK